MSELWLAVWLIAAALTFAAGTVVLVAIGLAWAIDEDRRGGRRDGGGGRRPRWHGRIETRGSDGSDLRVVSTKEDEA